MRALRVLQRVIISNDFRCLITPEVFLFAAASTHRRCGAAPLRCLMFRIFSKLTKPRGNCRSVLVTACLEKKMAYLARPAALKRRKNRGGIIGGVFSTLWFVLGGRFGTAPLFLRHLALVFLSFRWYGAVNMMIVIQSMTAPSSLCVRGLVDRPVEAAGAQT